jgi:lipoprotein NlpI
MPETDTTQRRDKTLIAVLAVLIALVTLAAYIPALLNEFVLWDDPVYVYKNLRIRSLDPGFFSWVLTAVVSSNWHPLTMVSHAVDYALWGLNPMGHHLTSIILHALNTGLVFMLGIRLAGSAGRGPGRVCTGGKAIVTGLAAALLFGLHPLHVESVAWVSERKDVLSALFFLLSLLAYLRYATGVRGGSSGRLNYAASLVLFGLALMSKPMAVTLPVVLLILDYYPLKRTAALKSALTEKLPFFALSAASAAITLWAQHKGEAMVSIGALVFPERVAMAIRGYAFYLYKMLLPVKLVPVYPMPFEGELFNSWFFVSLSLLVAITAFCIYTAVYPAKRRRAFLAVWLYFALTLLPVIGLVQVGMQAAADRYMYLPSIGPFMLAGLGAGLLFEKWTRARTVVIAVMVIVSALMAYMTVRQTGVWKDSLTLWSHEIRLYPDRVPSAHFNRGLAYAEKGDLARSIDDYNTAIALRTGMATVYAARGAALEKLGDFKRAIEDYDTAIAMRPEAVFYNNRGLAYARTRRIPDAIEDFVRAIELDPDYKDAHYNRALAYSFLGRHAEAIKGLTVTIGIDPGYADAYHNRGVAYANIGEYRLAIEDFSMAISIDPGDADSWRNRGLAYMRLGYTDEAASDYRAAERLN